jgi:hypothetical protein
LTISTGTITNYYGLLLNASTGSTITNRWGIYQNGANDQNYFKAFTGINATVQSAVGEALRVGLNGIRTAGLTVDGNISTRGDIYCGFNFNTFNGGYVYVRSLANVGFIIDTTNIGTGSHTTSGNHLPIIVNGVTYWIALLNPIIPS